jgi:hypothetical protein
MSQVLPAIQMPEKETPIKEPPPTKEISNEINEAPPAEQELTDEETQAEISEGEVFSAKHPPKMKPILKLEEGHLTDDEEPIPDMPAPKTRKKYERKRPMSEKQREHLSRIRQIASDRRAAERAEKAKKKEEEAELKAEQRLLAKKAKQERLEQESLEKPPPAQPRQAKQKIPEAATPQPQIPEGYYSREDMEKAMVSAISTYDTIRKKEKAEKKADLARQSREQKMRDTIQNAIQPQPVSRAPDPWRQLFH